VKKECLKMILDSTSFTYTGLYNLTERLLEKIFVDNVDEVTLEVTKAEKKTLNSELRFYPHLLAKAPKGADYHLIGPNALLITVNDNDDQ